MSKEQFPMPEPRPAVRNGEAFLEFVHDGQVVGQFNFSKVLKSWWNTFQSQQDKGHLELIP